MARAAVRPFSTTRRRRWWWSPASPDRPSLRSRERLKSILNISKEKLFENTASRIFYEDKASAHPADPKWYTFSVPGKNGTCSGHLTFLPSLPDDLARQIVFSLGPVVETHKGTN
jgi:hypothetical protein